MGIGACGMAVLVPPSACSRFSRVLTWAADRLGGSFTRYACSLRSGTWSVSVPTITS